MSKFTKSMKLSLLLILFSFSMVFAQVVGDYQTVAGGGSMNWSTPGNWQRHDGTSWQTTLVYPGQNAGDAQTVTIRSNGNPNVTLDLSPANSIVNLVVQSGSATELDVNANTLIVSSDVTINGDIDEGTGSGIIQVGGNYTINSGATFNNSTSGIDIDFNGSSGTQTVGGTYSGELRMANLTKSAASTVDWNLTGTVVIDGQFNLQLGTFQAGSATYSLNYGVLNGYGFNKTGGTFTAETSTVNVISGRNTRMTIENSVTFYNLKHNPGIGSSLSLNETNAAGAVYTIQNQFERSNASGGINLLNSASISYQSGKTLKYSLTAARNVSSEWPSSNGPANVTNSSSANVTLSASRTIPATGTFSLQQTGGNFVVSSGTLTINGTLERKTSGTVGITGSVGYASTGSYLKYGTDAATTIGAEWPASSQPENVTVNNTTGGVSSSSAISRTVTKKLDLAIGTLSLSTGTLTVLGTISGSEITGNATIANATTLLVGNSGSGTSFSQAIKGSLTLNKLTVYKTGGATDAENTVTLNGGQLNFTATSSLTITSGFLNLNGSGKFTNDPSTLTISSGGTLMTGGTSLTGITTISASSGKIEFSGSGSAETLPTGITIGTMEVDNGAGVTASSGTLTIGTSLVLTNGKIATTSSNILRLGSSATISGTPDSSKMISGPLQKAFATGVVSFDYPIGYNTSYRPATFSYASNNVATSIIEVEAVSGDPGGYKPSGITSIATSHYYKVTEKGTAGTFTYNFTGTYTGTLFSPATRNQLIVQIAAKTTDPSYSYPSAQTVSTVNETVTINDNLGALPTNDGIIAFGKGSAEVKWDNGGGNGQWTTSANWDGDVVPSSGDDVVLDNSIVAGNYIVTLSGATAQEISTLIIGDGVSNTVALSITNTNAAPLTINGSSGTPLQVLSDGVLTINGTAGGVSMSGNGAVSFAASSTYNLTTGTGITTSGLRTFNATSTTNIASTNLVALKAAAYGVLNISNASGTLTVGSSVSSQNFTMSGAGGVSITGGLTVTGDLNKSGNGTLLVNGGTLLTTGSLTVSAGTVYSDGASGLMSIGTTTNNTGTIRLDGTGNSSFSGAFTNNSGGDLRIETNAGTTTFSNTMANDGTLTLTGAGADPVTFTGAYTGTGSINASTGPAVTFSSTFTPSGSGSLTFGSQALTFDGNVTLNGGTFTPSSNTSFKGATLTVSGGSISSSAGTFKFERTSGAQSVANGSGSVTFPGLTINNSSGVTLNDPVSAAGTFTLTSGLLNTTTTNLLTLTSAASVSGGSSSSYVNGPMSHTGTGNKFYPIGGSGDYRPLELLTVTGTNPVVRFEMFASDPGGTAGTGLNNISVVRYWQGSVTGGTFGTAQVKLQWGSDDGVDGALADLRVAECATLTGAYTDAGNSGTTGSGTLGTVTSNSVSAMHYFTLGSASGDNSLPVELSSFAVSPQFGSVNLEWVTQSEINNQGFNIYRKDIDEDSEWSAINSTLIPGKGSYSNESVYNYVDKNVAGGHTYQYKLESVSISGIRVEEKIVEAVVPVPNEYVVFKNYPNPFNPATKIKFQLPETQNVKVTIYDMRGSKIRTLVNNNYPAGEHVVSWDATDNNGNRVASGLYVYRFEAGRFSKINKMILLK